MDNKACNKVQASLRKAKKKGVKDELDRVKQAEKKKRRLEKALATSAAIRSELEKKKLKKKEEQQRLDEEGAAIAEAVALHVLIGEDSDDSRNMVLNRENELKQWGYAGNFNLLMRGGGAYDVPQHVNSDCADWVSNPHVNGYDLAAFRNNNWRFTGGPCSRDLHSSYMEDGGWGSAEYSAGLIAAQAVSALRITEVAEVDTIMLNGMLRN